MKLKLQDSSSPRGDEESLGLTPREQRAGMRYTVWASVTGTVFHALLATSAVGALFIKKLGGSDFQSMLPLATILLGRAIQIPLSIHIPPRWGRALMLVFWTAALAIWTAAFLLPTFPFGRRSAGLFLAVLAVGLLLNEIGGVFWYPLLQDLVPTHQRGRFFGRLRAMWNFACFLSILAAGVFLGKDPTVRRFQVVFGAALGLFLLRIFFVAKIPFSSRLQRSDTDFEDWRLYVRHLFRQRPLVVFLVYYGVLGFCMGFLSQPLVLYMKARGFPTKDNVIIFSFQTLGVVLSYVLAGILVDRIGTKRVFLSAHLVLCLTCFAVVAIGMGPNASAMLLLPAAMIVAGGTIAASDVACTAQLFALIPHRGRAFCFSLAMIVTFAGTAISPLVAGRILDVVGYDWRWEVAGMKLDMFQVLLLHAGVLSLLAIGVLQAVQNVHPSRERSASSEPAEYTVKRRPGPPPVRAAWDGEYWREVPVLQVSQFHPDSSDHRPLVEAKLAHSGNALHVFFRVQDRYVRAVARNLNDPVYRDSCVELFLQPPGRKEYVNIEINCGGTLLAGYVEDPTRRDRHSPLAKSTPVTPKQASHISIEASLPKIVEPEIDLPTEWTVRYTVPLAFFEEFFGPLGEWNGQTWRGNLYKCGDGTSHPHWASWAPLGKELNFHQPDKFAPLRFEK